MDRIASWLLVRKEGMSEGKIVGSNAAERRTKADSKKNLYCGQNRQFSKREVSLLVFSTDHGKINSSSTLLSMKFAVW